MVDAKLHVEKDGLSRLFKEDRMNVKFVIQDTHKFESLGVATEEASPRECDFLAALTVAW